MAEYVLKDGNKEPRQSSTEGKIGISLPAAHFQKESISSMALGMAVRGMVGEPFVFLADQIILAGPPKLFEPVLLLAQPSFFLRYSACQV